ncbi:unnamed protein product [Spodoptera exigua]|nr:unnamed protein product [Spodoptera exigua]
MKCLMLSKGLFSHREDNDDKHKNDITNKPASWYDNGTKSGMTRFVKNSETYKDDTYSSEEISSDSIDSKIREFLNNLTNNYIEFRNENKITDSNSNEKKKHMDTKDETKIIERQKDKHGKSETQISEKDNSNQNSDRNHKNQKEHNEKIFYERSRITEGKHRDRDEKSNSKPKKNKKKIHHEIKYSKNDITSTEDRKKDIKSNINIKRNKIKSEIHSKHTTTGTTKKTKLNKLRQESLPSRVWNTVKEWSTPNPSKLRTHRKKDKIALRSTRMPPMALNQFDDSVKKINNAQRSKYESPPNTLSPYAIMTQMKMVMDCFPSANSTFEIIGRTAEYNDIVIVKITDRKQRYFRVEESKYVDEVPEKKIIFIVHGLSVMGMAAMEHLSSVEELKILMSYYLNHLDKFDIFLIPLANPDGYSLTHNENGMMWNKNASPQEACRGVYLDRNFDVAWNSSRPISSCSQLYPGPAPFSEVETNAIRNIFHYFGHKILAYINVHSGTYDSKVFKGDAILFPYGYTETQFDDDKYIDLKGEVDEAMKNASFRVMSVAVESLYNWYGRISGSSVDYAAAVYGIPYAFEFVMQLYQQEGSGYPIQHYALTEIWSRLINTVFNNMWKSLRMGDTKK